MISAPNDAASPCIRAATFADLESARALIAAADLETEGIDALFNETPAAFTVACAPEALQTLTATGGLEVYGDVALLRSVAVRPDSRGTGVGRLLVTRILDNAAQRGVHTVYLLTTTAAAYFERLGFVRTARDGAPDAIRATAQFAGGCVATAVAMKKTVTPGA